jgi:hypothetical protein
MARPMSAKETALQVICKLSDDVTWGQLTEELYAAAVREGLDSSGCDSMNTKALHVPHICGTNVV